MYKINIYTTLVVSSQMVTSWELVDSASTVVADLTLPLSSVPADFYLNYLDYEVIGGTTLAVIATPVGDTMIKIATNTDYPLAITRATSMGIFATL